MAIIDQSQLPHRVQALSLRSAEDAAIAISTMQVRGAPLIGITAAYGLALGLRLDPSDAGLQRMEERLAACRPTAVNLRWALRCVACAVGPLASPARADAAYALAGKMAQEDVEACRRIGAIGAQVIHELYGALGRTVNILTHCNAGWLAAVDWGTALAPIYVARDLGVPIHVWVDETRPRNQGSALTAFELGHENIDHTIIVDNAGGHLMQHGKVDMCIVGADRITGRGDVANKIGTYLKALAARENGVPFYVAAPISTIDWTLLDGVREIPIEEREAMEITHAWGTTGTGDIGQVRMAAPGSRAANYAFDVTPAALITGIISERGISAASRAALGAWSA